MTPLSSFDHFIKQYPGREQVTLQVTSIINGIGFTLYVFSSPLSLYSCFLVSLVASLSVKPTISYAFIRPLLVLLNFVWFPDPPTYRSTDLV
jgi:hypothetical protein